MWPVSLFGCGPLIRHALRRATFPVGEGDLPAGAFHTLSLERVVRRTDLVPPLIRRCGGTFPQGKVKSFYFHTA